MFDFVARENTIFEILKAFRDGGLSFLVIGGYAVSAYRHRFSVDADVVIMKDDLAKFETVLRENGFSKYVSRALDHPYAEFTRYEKKENKVSVDLLINGVMSRQTGAFFSYLELAEHSEEREVIGTEKSVVLMVPAKEMLIALKLHAGRLTDFRDVAALSYNLDLTLLKKFLPRGDVAVVKENLKKLSQIIDEQNFVDSFKGVFAERNFRIDIKEIRKVCDALGSA